AQHDNRLLKGPLCELATDDFSEGDYRALLGELKIAVTQDDVDPIDDLREALDEFLLKEMETLLLDEVQEVHRHVNQEMGAEFEDIWKQYARRIRPGIDDQAVFIKSALKVRHQRLEREQQE